MRANDSEVERAITAIELAEDSVGSSRSSLTDLSNTSELERQVGALGRVLGIEFEDDSVEVEDNADSAVEDDLPWARPGEGMRWEQGSRGIT